MVYRGSCHCGRVALEVEGELDRVEQCNCSVCAKKGYLHWIVPRLSVRLLGNESALGCYRFNTGVASHTFCTRCGVKPFYVPRSNPDGWSVNVNCLASSTIERVDVVAFDGQHWKEHAEELRHLSEETDAGGDA